MNNPAILLNTRQNNGEFPIQKSKEWYEKRNKILTASQIASILNKNIYQSPFDILVEKIYSFINNDKYITEHTHKYTDWGNKFEPIAVKFYEFLKEEKVIEIGLVVHSKFEWLGASPDGLLMSGNLLEIKCPFTRNITNDIPNHYWIQIQIQLEVCNMEYCDYLECDFYEYKNEEEYKNDNYDSDLKGFHIKQTDTSKETSVIYWRINKCFLKSVKRDKTWFNSVVNSINDFYITLENIKSIVLKTINKKKCHDKNDIIKFIKNTIYKYNRKDFSLKKNPEKDYCINWEIFVSASSVRNYMIDDPLIDYLEFIDRNNRHNLNLGININWDKKYKQNDFISYIYQKGDIFKSYIIGILKDKFKDDIVTISNKSYDIKSINKFNETVECIKKGVPIIHHGILHDYDKKIYGIPDLLVRIDYIPKLLNQMGINNCKVVRTSPNDTMYKYTVVEIKYTNINIRADGIHIINTTKEISYNKAQLYIYNKILGKIQNFELSHAYIIGKSYKYKKDGITFIKEPLDMIGRVDFKNNDKFIRKKTALAIKWIRELRKNAYCWKLLPPSRDELKPNMCNINDKWQSIKEDIATQTNDITQLWMCNIENRKIAESKKIINWRNHKNLRSEDLGIKGNNSKILQIIIDMNQSINTNKIHPNKLPKHTFTKNSEIEFYVDFETINSSLLDIKGDFIFMIGVGYIFNDEWKFKCFITEDLTQDSELNILNQFHEYITEISLSFSIKKNKKVNKYYTLWHWGNAEKHIYNSAIQRHGIDNIFNDKWKDLLNIFKKNNIVTRGMLNFSLKSVVKSFNDNNFIKTSYQDLDIVNGMDAMIAAYNEYMNNTSEIYKNKTIKKIENYNEIDCKSIYEILYFLKHKYNCI